VRQNHVREDKVPVVTARTELAKLAVMRGDESTGMPGTSPVRVRISRAAIGGPCRKQIVLVAGLIHH
jgi:hypothetical protein